MRQELEKLINDLNALSLSDEQLEQFHQYQDKLDALEAYLLKHRDDGETDCMLQATKAFMFFREKIVNNPLADFDYLKANITHIGWKNEGLRRSKNELFETLDRIEELNQSNIEVRVYALLGIASVDYHHGDHESSIATLNKVKVILPLFNDENSNYFQINTHANMHNSYGLAYRAMSNYTEALSHFKKSLSILQCYTKDSGLDGPKLALMNNIGAIFTKQKKWKEALLYFESYDDFVQSQLKGNETHNYVRVQLSTLLINMSFCYTYLNQYNLALEKLITAEQLIDGVEPVYQYLKTNLLFSKSTLYRKSGNYNAAVYCAQQSFQYTFSNFQSSNIHENPKMAEVDFSKMQKFIVEPFIAKSTALLACYENEKKDLNLLQICLKTIDEIAIYFNKIRGDFSGQASKFSLAYYSKNLFDIGQLACWYLYQATSDNQFTEKSFAYCNQNKALVLLEEMNEKWFKGSEQNINIASIQKKLKNGESLLEFSVGEKGMFVYYLSKKGLIHFDHITKNKTELIKQQVDRWLKYHFNIYSPNQYQNYQNEAYELYYNLLSIIDKEIEDNTNLIIAPDDFLNAVPFEALSTRNKSVNSYIEIDYLIDRNTIAYTFSSYLFYLNRKKVHANIKSNFLYVSPNFLANKTLEEHQQIEIEQTALLQKAALVEMNHYSQDAIHYNEDFNLALLHDEQPIIFSKKALLNLLEHQPNQVPQALLYNATLVRRLIQIIESKFIKVVLLENVEAKVSTFNERVGEASCILISSHAEIDEGILFFDEKGIDITSFSYERIKQLNIHAQLVILNMCDSGRGKSIFGEGYLSLGRAFFAAGSLNVIQTLYKVSDKYSANLIASFFTFLTKQQLDFYAALRQAKLLLRNEKSSHPKFWAGHVIYGKNGNL